MIPQTFFHSEGVSMTTWRTPWIAAGVVGMVVLSVAVRAREAADKPLVHMVYFTLKDHSQESRDKMSAACQKYLSNHAGTLYFSAGTRANEITRDINDQDFDISLNLVFKDKAAFENYLTNPRHLKFIEENRESWAKVRVFDSYQATP